VNVVQTEIDRLLSQGIQEIIGDAQPSDHIWQRIEHKLGAGPSPTRHRSNRRAWRLGPFVQALALAGVLVALGLSLDHRLPWSRFYAGGEPTVAVTPLWSADRDSDVESLDGESLIMGHEPGFLSPRQMHSVSISADDGVLSKGQILQSAGEQGDEGQSTGHDASLGLVPAARHRSD
jgi:hypothetical protein